MRVLGLSDLPAPPPGKSGWPWTETAPPAASAGQKNWPSISIVTPSYNQGKYIEATIRSVLLQGYENLEYSVVDGGSTDETVDIIRKYEAYLTWWVSEKDRGQSDAINKGFAKATGEIWNWLCSDDQLTQGALQKIGREFMEDGSLSVLAGACIFRHAEGIEEDKIMPCKAAEDLPDPQLESDMAAELFFFGGNWWGGKI